MSQWLVFRQELGKTDAAAPLLVSLSRATSGQRLSTDGARYIAEQYYKALGLSPELWGLHTLRRTAGTQLYRATRDLHVVADLLGHASINTSAIYAEWTWTFVEKRGKRWNVNSVKRLRSVLLNCRLKRI